MQATALARDGFRCAYVLPVTDDGGSTHEIRRVFGGPAIGDIRSRLSALELTGVDSCEKAFFKLLRKRLNEDEAIARAEWQDLLKEDHTAWKQEREAADENMHFACDMLTRAVPTGRAQDTDFRHDAERRDDVDRRPVQTLWRYS